MPTTRSSALSSRPDRLILVYPVIALATPFGHRGSLRQPSGENPSQELIESLSNERQVTKDTPPTFLAHTNADTGVPAENSFLFAMALRKAGVPVELHLFERGPARPRAGLGIAAVQGPAGAVLPGLAQAVRDLAEEPGISRDKVAALQSGTIRRISPRVTFTPLHWTAWSGTSCGATAPSRSPDRPR